VKGGGRRKRSVVLGSGGEEQDKEALCVWMEGAAFEEEVVCTQAGFRIPTLSDSRRKKLIWVILDLIQ
jgi:hypothetical protein